jgi:hypothetical protein
MRPAAKRYNTAYKKKILERDVYLPRQSPRGIIQCGGCGAFYYRRRWTLKLPAGVQKPVPAIQTFCPACHKIKQNYPLGELRLLGVKAADQRSVVSIMRNEEERAREKNPLERIMKMSAKGGDWKVETTTEKLAQRLGRSLRKARGGRLLYKWGHNNKFVRVVWEKPAK